MNYDNEGMVLEILYVCTRMYDQYDMLGWNSLYGENHLSFLYHVMYVCMKFICMCEMNVIVYECMYVCIYKPASFRTEPATSDWK